MTFLLKWAMLGILTGVPIAWACMIGHLIYDKKWAPWLAVAWGVINVLIPVSLLIISA